MISFFSEYKGYKVKNVRVLKAFLKNLCACEGFKVGDLSYVFMSDDDLLKINIEYLNHDTYTDIITFDNSEHESLIEGDIFISIDRIKENSEKFKVSFEDELIRVISHGVLHLCGYKDKTAVDSKEMKAKENEYLSLYKSL